MRHNNFNKCLKHILLIIDNCGYNDTNESILFTKGDYFADNYYYDLIYKKNIIPHWTIYQTKLDRFEI